MSQITTFTYSAYISLAPPTHTESFSSEPRRTEIICIVLKAKSLRHGTSLFNSDRHAKLITTNVLVEYKYTKKGYYLHTLIWDTSGGVVVCPHLLNDGKIIHDVLLPVCDCKSNLGSVCVFLQPCICAVPRNDWSDDQWYSNGGHAAQPQQRPPHLSGIVRPLYRITAVQK